MPVVYIEGVGNVSFPDSMSPQEIESQINSMMRQQESAAQMGGLEAFGRGALQSVKDIGFGAQQLGAEAGEAIGLVDPQTVQRLRQEESARREQNAAFMGTGAGQAGYLLGSVGSLLVPGAALGRLGGAAGAVARGISAPTTFGGAAAGGGLLGALQPLEEGERRTSSAALGALGGVAGQGIARGASRLAQPVTSAPSPQQARAVSRLMRAGVPVDIAEQTGSENLRLVRRFLMDNPLTAGGMRKAQEAQQTAFNRAALRLVGEQGDAAIPEVLQRAHERIGSVMDDVAQKYSVKIDNQMIDDLAKVENVARKTVSSNDFVPIKNQLDDILQKLEVGDTISGEAYQNIRSNAATLAKNNPQLTETTRQLREAIDSALERTAGGADAAALKTARKQYRNLMKVEDSIAANELGDISVPKLAAATSRKGERAAALRNRGDAELARLARSAATVRETFPQSGTAQRAALQTLGGTLIPGLGAAGYSAAQGNELSEAAMFGLAGGALGVATPLAMSRAFRSPAAQRYLMRGIQTPLLRQPLLSPALRGGLTYTPAAIGLLDVEE